MTVDNRLPVPSLTPSPLPAASLVQLDHLSDAERREAMSIAKGIDFADGDSILAQMTGPRQEFADTITRQLAGIAVYETGAATEIILSLSRQIKAANLTKMKREVTGEDWIAARFSGLPIIGRRVSAIRHFQLTHASLIGELERIKSQANAELSRLRAIHRQLDEQEAATERMLRKMMVHIAGCQQAAAEARAQFDQRREAALASGDPFEMQAVRDFAENLAVLETRLLGVQASFLDGMMAIPDIRARQHAARIEMANTIDTIHNDLPDLAAAIGRLVAAYHISQAQKANALRRANRQALEDANAVALETVYLGAKASQDDRAALIGELSNRLDRLLATLDAGSKIDAANVDRRREAAAKLVSLRDRLVKGIAANAKDALKSA
jgi:hypothetical protein